MRRRAFVVAGEYGSNPRLLTPQRRSPEFLAERAQDPTPEELERLFFRYPNRSEDGRARPADWERDFQLPEPISLSDLFASAAHRALSSLHALTGDESYRRTCERITDLIVTSMPGLDPNERMNVGLVPQTLQATLQLSRRARCQFVAGTSDSGAWAFAQAVRAARSAERGATVLVLAAQIIPSGYASQYQIRTVLGDLDQARGLDMLVVGDLLMDGMRRNLGQTRESVEAALAAVSARKFRGALAYPSAMFSGRSPRRNTRRTPYFDGDDIAAPCCGAAATVVTSDEDLVERVRQARSARHAASPLVEVLGVGEGSSNPNFLERQSPVLFATAVREAFAATAEDASVAPAALPGAAFAVVHDAFPSIELAFLLGLGLDWDRAVERMRDGWSNPYGGLLTFGHALGASGLVQVNKTQHILSGDRRYVRGAEAVSRPPEPGALAFTTSVGGPLSHVVVTLFRGGDGEALAQDHSEAVAGWVERRRRLRRALPVHLARLQRMLSGRARPHLVEGVTYVSIRSCLRALGPRDIAALTFDGVEYLFRPERLGEVRIRLRELVSLVVAEAERLSSLFDVFRVLTDELVAMADGWRGQGLFVAETAALPPQRLVERLKECLRVPVLVTCAPEGQKALREVHFLPLDGLGYEALLGVDLLLEEGGRFRPVPSAESAGLLPWWNLRARRPPGGAPEGSAEQRVSALLSTEGATLDERASDLGLLRTWTLPDARPWALELDGASAPRTSARAVAYVAEIVPPTPSHLGAAQEAVASAVREARAWLHGWTVSFSQAGTQLWMVGSGAEGADLAGVLRFAREVARATISHGVRLRAAMAAGSGVVFDDVEGRPSVASDVAARAAAAVAALAGQLPSNGASPRAALLLDGGIAATAVPQRELGGWRTFAVSVPGALYLLD
jgi:hypothetical protein